MRTLQEKYNAIQEGNFSKDQFLVEARMQHPNLVTRFNGYDDAVQILKNRGMISEVKIEEARLTEAKGYSFTFNYNTDPDDVEYIQRVLDNAGADAIAKAGTFDDEMIVRAFDAIGLRKARKAIEADGFEINENVNEARLTKNSLTDYRYKPTNDMDKYPYEQILRGLRVELEVMEVHGTPTAEEYKKALGKVLKNLEKDEIFYTNQLAGSNKKVDLHDKMVDATAKNTVDTFNGMKKATLKEGIKNLIKKALMENEEDVYEMQGPKSDDEYKSELADYLEDNQIYGYTNKIHNIMTGPDEDEAYRELAEYLDSEGIYGYTRAIERIYADYPYDQHWMNQDEDDNSYAPTEHEEEDEDDIPHPRGYEEASDEESFEDLFESKSLKDLL